MLSTALNSVRSPLPPPTFLRVQFLRPQIQYWSDCPAAPFPLPYWCPLPRACHGTRATLQFLSPAPERPVLLGTTSRARTAAFWGTHSTLPSPHRSHPPPQRRRATESTAHTPYCSRPHSVVGTPSPPTNEISHPQVGRLLSWSLLPSERQLRLLLPRHLLSLPSSQHPYHAPPPAHPSSFAPQPARRICHAPPTPSPPSLVSGPSGILTCLSPIQNLLLLNLQHTSPNLFLRKPSPTCRSVAIPIGQPWQLPLS